MKGLTSHEVKGLLKQHGLNEITEGAKKTFIQKCIEQFNNFLTLLLLSAAFLSFIIGEPVDGVLIVAIVILNALFGLYQEAKAEESIALLKKMSVARVRVIRDGLEQEIQSNYIVPGDICIIEEGVKIPADARVISAMNLEINESVLTGESLPVVKQEKDEVFSGTIVSKGRGHIEILQTGMKTKFGQIASSLSSIEDSETPLQKKLRSLTRTIGIVGIIAAVLVFFISFLQGSSYFPAFLLSISLAVAVVPEGLPAVMTITLAIGVNEMSKKKSIVRKLSAIEALGSITLIATDKTGTLTTNKMKVKEVFVDDNLYTDSVPRIENHPFRLLLYNGVLCSTASLVYKHDHGSYDVLGDPTEGALLYLSQEQGIEIQDLRNEWKTIEEEPFDSVTKRMSVRVGNKLKKNEEHVFTKGAPESILDICSFVQKGNQQHPLTLEERKKLEKQVDSWARKGLRVLAFAEADFGVGPADRNVIQSHIDTKKFVFLGMVAIHDAPRPEVNEAVQRAKDAGIRVVMITGDNERTAEAIGVTTGIIEEGEDIITGKQLETYSDEQLLALLPQTKIFARTTPFHKHRIVSLYQKLGEIVAVTGDGVNDAIALKQADVGIAMGLVGTDVARETADMVITDDNFASIVNAVEEGRNIIKNLKNAIQYLLSCNISEAISLIGGLMLGFTHLFYPLQLLYINLITDGIPALSLSFSPRDPHLMKQKPNKQLRLLEGKEQLYILAIGFITSVIILVSYVLFKTNLTEGSAKAMVFSVLTLIQSFIYVDLWLSHRSLHTNLKKLISPLFIGSFIFPFVTQFVIVRTPFISKLFSVGTLSYAQFIIAVFISSTILLGIRGVKKAYNK